MDLLPTNLIKKSLEVDGWLEITGTASVFLCCVGVCLPRACVSTCMVCRACCVPCCAVYVACCGASQDGGSAWGLRTAWVATGGFAARADSAALATASPAPALQPREVVATMLHALHRSNRGTGGYEAALRFISPTHQYRADFERSGK